MNKIFNDEKPAENKKSFNEILKAAAMGAGRAAVVLLLCPLLIPVILAGSWRQNEKPGKIAAKASANSR